MQILSEVQEQILRDERRILNDLRVKLVQFQAEPETTQALGESIAQLDDLFLLVVAGEFNAGKSAFINALLGERLLQEGVTPTTTQINILRHGESKKSTFIKENQILVELPSDWLREVSIVDTPGTNAIMRSHEAITTEFIPRSDLVLFITSADRPFTESERLFLERIRTWGKKVVMVINKIDILQNPEEIDQVRNFINENAKSLLGVQPEVFPVSARLALRAKQGKQDDWEISGFQQIESYIQKTLDESSRIRLKLLNPLGVGMHLLDEHIKVVAERLSTLKADTQMLVEVDDQLRIFNEDMERDFSYRMSDMENIFYEMEKRGLDFFDSTFKITRIKDLLSKDRIRHAFEVQVVADIPQQIEEKVNGMIDWLVDSDLRQWQAVNNHLAERRRAYQDHILGEMGPGSFTYDRERQIDALGHEAQRVVESYDKGYEAQAIADGAKDAVAALAVLEVGAVGLGTLVATLASTASADLTGILLATAIAALGFVIIPAKRRAAKTELSAKINLLREKLINTLGKHFKKEMVRSSEKIQTAITPYTRFVRAEQSKLDEVNSGFVDIRQEILRLKNQIETL